MIALTSSPTQQATERLAGYEAQRVEALANGYPMPPAVASGYRHEDVKAAIVAETHEKCAYCESKVTHVYWGDVEHMVPRVHAPARMLDYANLTLACAVCNNAKGVYYNPTAPILNPYEDDCDAHLVALGQLVWHRNGSDSGRRTITLLKLNREDLVERRLERLQLISRMADQYTSEPEGPIKRILLEQLRDLATDAAEFALIGRTFLRQAHGIELELDEAA